VIIYHQAGRIVSEGGLEEIASAEDPKRLSISCCILGTASLALATDRSIGILIASRPLRA
jgi:hypothetical protein